MGTKYDVEACLKLFDLWLRILRSLFYVCMVFFYGIHFLFFIGYFGTAYFLAVYYFNLYIIYYYNVIIFDI